MASDSFTDTNGTTLPAHDSNWINMSASYAAADLTIQSNQVRPPTWGDGAGAAYSNGQSADQESQIVWKGASNAVHTRFVSVRAAGTGTNRGYYAKWHNSSGGNFTSVAIEKDGTFLAQNAAISYAVASDHTVKITATDNGGNVDLEVFIDGTSELTHTDTTSVFTDGYPGFGVIPLGTPLDAESDDWEDGILAGGSTVSISASGSVTATGESTVDSPASVGASGQVDWVGEATSIIDAESEVNATASVTMDAEATVGTNSDINAAGQIVWTGEDAGSGTTDAAFNIEAYGFFYPGTQGTLFTAEGEATSAADLDINGGGLVVAAGESAIATDINLNASSSITMAAEATGEADVDINSTAAVIFGGEGLAAGESDFTVTATSQADWVGEGDEEAVPEVDSATEAGGGGGGWPSKEHYRRKKRLKQQQEQEFMELIALAMPQILAEIQRISVSNITYH